MRDLIKPGWLGALVVGLFLWGVGVLQSGTSSEGSAVAFTSEMKTLGLLLIAAGAATGLVVLAFVPKKRSEDANTDGD
jgi:hypothetical protein